MDAAYADHPIITQLDDGATDIATGEGYYTSSLSAPGVVVDFLELLRPYEGDRVLEIGTGTGWTAALLSHRVGEANLTSIEIDEAVLDVAAENLKKVGYGPLLLLGDGTLGCPDQAPFDRVHVTCGVASVPYAWVEQTRPGGIIVFPWMPGIEPGHKAVLTVGRNGVASGRFSKRGASYMMLRDQRVPGGEYLGDYRESTAAVDPRRIFRGGVGLDVAMAGLMPGVSATTKPDEPFQVSLWFGESAAHVAGDEVTQYGDRNLWDELEDVFFAWIEWGSPDRDRFGLTVTPGGQYVWLDTPDTPVTAIKSRA
ncbi:methyltransferase domain-containing protein [Sphaerisporangium sp. NPDC051017]|uniref:methyltransferase domain-containing protein n=1 Tax=Sphaerisporangium sp. NPDC051017 TaxID=3154636 RepID=UPI00342E392C